MNSANMLKLCLGEFRNGPPTYARMEKEKGAATTGESKGKTKDDAEAEAEAGGTERDGVGLGASVGAEARPATGGTSQAAHQSGSEVEGDGDNKKWFDVLSTNVPLARTVQQMYLGRKLQLGRCCFEKK